MSHLFEDVVREHPQTVAIAGLFQGVISKAPATLGAPVSVILRQFVSGGLNANAPTTGSLPQQELTGCRWQSRDATSLPAKGMVCLVAIDDYNEPWVIAWWPF